MPVWHLILLLTITEGIVGIVNNEVILLSELEDLIYATVKKIKLLIKIITLCIDLI